MPFPFDEDKPLPFADLEARAWPFWYRASLRVNQICGGVPASPDVAAKWVEAKLKDTRSKQEVQRLVSETQREIRETHVIRATRQMELEAASVTSGGKELEQRSEGGLYVAQEMPSDEQLLELAIKKSAEEMAGLNMFKRVERGLAHAGALHIEGRQIKAALKEGAQVAANAGKIPTGKWGDPDNATYKKGLKGWLPEHVFVPDTTVPLFRMDGTPVMDPDGILTKFVHTHRGDAIAFEEFVLNAVVTFMVKTDVEISREHWGMIWLTSQDQGLGASRSQGYGVYTILEWEQVDPVTSSSKATMAKVDEFLSHPETGVRRGRPVAGKK